MRARSTQGVVALLAVWAMVLIIATACGGGGEDAASPSPYSGYLAQEIPPCTPIEGATVDPCEPGKAPNTDIPAGIGSRASLDEPTPLRRYLDGGSLIAVPHLVVRATYIPNTGRCVHDNPNREAPYEAPGGWFGHSTVFQCYADVRVNSYILGTGPSRLAVQTTFYHYFPDFISYAASTMNMTEEEWVWDVWVSTYLEVMERGPEPGGSVSDGIYGREAILFIGPSHNRSVGGWQVFATWNVERAEADGDPVIAVHPLRDRWRAARPSDYDAHRAALEMPLSTFTQAVQTAHQARLTEYGGKIAPDTISGKLEGATLPELISDANQLSQHYVATGESNHPDGPPELPPPPCGLAVTGPIDNARLMADCMMLLGVKDPLRGAGALNWTTSTQMADWDGVTVAGTPQRVTKLKLANKSLTGTIPAALAGLTELNELKLAGNNLTGCIPLALKAVASHDLDSLGLLYCRPPAPGNVSTGAATETGIPLSWDAVSNAGKYQLTYWTPTDSGWAEIQTITASATKAVDGLVCAEQHHFQASAYGSGTVYAEARSEPSPVYAAFTTACVSPAFDQDPYGFRVAYTAVTGDAVGTVSAQDPNGDAVTYTITAGNGDGDAASLSTETEVATAGSRRGRAQGKKAAKRGRPRRKKAPGQKAVKAEHAQAGIPQAARESAEAEGSAAVGAGQTEIAPVAQQALDFAASG